MQWPNFLKIKLPQFKKPSIPKVIPPKISFYSAWKRFMRQIPTESRSIVKTHQHFVVLGGEKSGKTELIQGLIEQSQDLYPFETTLTELPEMQFYLGPRQVIQEISFETLENRSIRIRKQVIKLWKKLFAAKDPVILITYDCSMLQSRDLKEANKLAQLIAGKITLLSEIRKRPLKTRIALTHMDKIPGYVEFARFLKQQNISFSIDLSSNFESNTLTDRFKEFAEKYLSLILTTVSQDDYLKIIHFIREMPLIFPAVEEFLRALASRVSFKDAIEIDRLAFTSNQEVSSSYPLFEWARAHPTDLFFRYPMLKHQLAAACLLVGTLSVVFTTFYKVRHELHLVQLGIEQLDLLQFETFKDKTVPGVEKMERERIKPMASLTSHFYKDKLKTEKNRLAHRIRKHLIESEYRKTIFENKGELKYLYFVGLMRASADNRLGKFIRKNSSQWAQMMSIDENLMKMYISCCSEPVSVSQLSESKASPFLSLTSLSPWLNFMKKFQEIKEQPIFVEQTYEEIIRETEKLLTALLRLRSDPLVFGLATLLDEEGFMNNDNVKTVHWIGENVDALEDFLTFLKQSYVAPSNMQGMNPAQFFVMLKEFASKAESENELYNFAIENQVFSFDSNIWTQRVVTYNIEKALQEYMALNADTDGSLFFHNIQEPPTITLAHSQIPHPFFTSNITIPGRYSRIDYERRIRSTLEKLAAFVESLSINPEEKKRFLNFLVKEATNYIKTYQDKYVHLFDSYKMEAESPRDLKKMLGDLTKTSSPFYEFLKTVEHQTSSFSESLITLKNIEEFNNFTFLIPILAEKEGKAPLDEYKQLMAQVLKDLEAPSGVLANNSYSTLQLMPIERLTVNIFQQTQESYMKKVQECVAQLGVPERFSKTFYQPIALLYEIGLKELKKSFEHHWKMVVYPQVEAVFNKFPFNSESKEIASLDEVNVVLNPKSKFYQDIEKMIAIFCYFQEGRWVPISSNCVGLETAIYDQLNRVTKVAHTLWDSEGNPKAIVCKVRPVPFTESAETATVPIKSCIMAGLQSIHNINQDPTWQPLNVEWWKNDQSLVGMTVVSKGGSSKSYRSIQPAASLWSFFTLLKEGKQGENSAWNWNLMTKEGQDSQQVSFLFETNPQDFLNYQEQR